MLTEVRKLLEEAKKAPEQPRKANGHLKRTARTVDYLPVVRELKKKGYSWQQIGKWFAARGVKKSAGALQQADSHERRSGALKRTNGAAGAAQPHTTSAGNGGRGALGGGTLNVI